MSNRCAGDRRAQANSLVPRPGCHCLPTRLDASPRGRDAEPMRHCSATTAALTSLALGAAAVAPPRVQAAPPTAARAQAEAKALEAKAYFTQGLYEEAAAAFMEAYAISRAPDMMYNAARAYQEARRPDKARALFKTYLNLDGVSEEGRQDARQRIAKLEDQMAKESVPAEPAPAGDPRAPGPAVPLAAPATAAASSPTSDKPAPSQGLAAGGTPAGADALGWGALSGGGALLAISGLAYWGALTAANDANKLEIDSAGDARDYNSAFDRAEQLRNASVGLAVAGAGLAAYGAWRLWLRPGPQAESTGLWLAPAWGGAGFAAGGRF